jgi:molecular chaperone HscB
MNYFEIFKINKSFKIDKELVEKQYLTFQKQFHPDKVGISEIEKSILINDAYKTLLDDFLRAAYILKLENINILDDTKAPQVSFETLTKIMELQEKISESDNLNELSNIKKSLQDEVKLQFTEVSKFLLENNFEKAAQELIKIKYLKKSLEDIKNKKRKIL